MTLPWSIAQTGCPACNRPALNRWQNLQQAAATQWSAHTLQLRRTQLPAVGPHLEEGPLPLQVVNVLQGRRAVAAAIIH